MTSELMCLECRERPGYKGGPLCLDCGYAWQLRVTGTGPGIPPVDKASFVDQPAWTEDDYRRYLR